MLRSIKSSQRLPRCLLFRVTGATPLINEGATDATIARTAAGDYTLTFIVPFLRTPVVMITPVSTTGDVISSVHTVSTTSLRVVFCDGTDGVTLKEANFHLQVVGFDSADFT